MQADDRKDADILIHGSTNKQTIASFEKGGDNQSYGETEVKL